MTRLPSSFRLLTVASALAAVAAGGLSCSTTPNLLPVNDLNRPADVAFMCFGATDPTGSGETLTVSGRPMRACHPQNVYDPPASVTTRTFAFMPQSGNGGLTVVDANHWKLIDLDAFTGGFGTAPLGQLPGQISASDDGCRLLTANRGSCDLSLVDPSVLVAPTFYGQQSHLTNIPSPRTATLTIRPVKSDGTFLTAAPYEAVFLPQDTSDLVSSPDQLDPAQACSPDGAHAPPIGWPAQGQLTPWYALVTYPSCDLIAIVELPSGRLVSSAKVRRTADGKSVTLVDAGRAPSCPIDCVGQALPAGGGAGSPAADGGATADSGATADGGSMLPTATDGGPAGQGGGPGAASDAGAPVSVDAAVDATAAGGAPGSAGAPADGGSPAGGAGGAPGAPAFPGNQYADVPYVPGPGAGPISPSGISIVPDGSRAYVGLANASYVMSVGLSSGALSLPGNPIYLHEGARGTARVRLNVDPYRYLSNPGQAGIFVGAEAGQPNETLDAGGLAQDVQRRKYLYAIAKDGTVRVVNIFLPGAETECETNIDPMNLPRDANGAPTVSSSTACIKIDPVHRRPFSVGPGIRLPALPVDVAAADVRTGPTEDNSEQSVNGAYAWVITASGVVYLVNINPVLRHFTAAGSVVTEGEPYLNTLRDRNQISYAVTLDPSSGPPRVDVLPSIPSTGPYIEPFWTQGSELNATAQTTLFVQTVAFFPKQPFPSSPQDPIDRRAVTPQEWTITWEGALGGTRNTGIMVGAETSLGRFPPGTGDHQKIQVDSLLLDNGTNYCQSGVLAGDLVTLTGCTQNNQCGPGEVCMLDATVSSTSAGQPVNGLCADPNRLDAKALKCAAFLQTVRRYRVIAAFPNQVVIRPHLDELVRTSLTRCGDDADNTAYLTGHNAASLASCANMQDPTTKNFTCEVDPEGGATKRCLNRCDSKKPCRAGRVCIDLGSKDLPAPADCDTKPCFCADAPPFRDEDRTACFDQLTAYQVQVGDGFLVSGSQSGYLTTAVIPPGDQQCAANPTPDPRFTFRIPMNAPLCTNVPASIAGIDSRVDPDSYQMDAYTTAADNARALAAVAGSTPAPSDPCLYWGGPAQGDPLGAMPLPQHVRALFQNAQLNFVLNNLDRGPTGQFSSVFDVHGGFAPQVVQDPVTVEVSMPTRIVYGPVDALPQVTPGADVSAEERYLFVVDQRRLGREQGGAPTRGQLLRIHPLGYSATVGSATGQQPIFEDYNASGGVFPIQ